MPHVTSRHDQDFGLKLVAVFRNLRNSRATTHIGRALMKAPRGELQKLAGAIPIQH